MLNKGSSNVVNQLDTGDAQTEQETSSPDGDTLKNLQKYGKRIREEENQYEDSSSDSLPKRVRFAEDLVEDEDHFLDDIENYFHGRMWYANIESCQIYSIIEEELDFPNNSR